MVANNNTSNSTIQAERTTQATEAAPVPDPNVSSVRDAGVAKKRKRPKPAVTSDPTTDTTVTKKKKRVGADSAVRKVKVVKNVSPQKLPTTTSTPAPTRILIIDNGGDTLKYGWSTDTLPSLIPNKTARLPQQWTVLVGDQLSTVQNPSQLIGVTHSTERGVVVNLGNQVQVWKRLLDLLHVSVPTHTETAQAFGWKIAARARAADPDTPEIPAATCAVLLALAPHTPRIMLDLIVQTWLEDLGFAHVGLCVSAVAAAQNVSNDYDTCCVVDLGWSATHIVPTHRQQVLDSRAIRRVPIGGRHLINAWKHFCSYRQWNLMEQEFIVRDVWERTAYVSLDFHTEIALARRLPAGQRPYDREFVLPDFQKTTQGRVQLPAALQLQQPEQEVEQIKTLATKDEFFDDESVGKDEIFGQTNNEDDSGDNDDAEDSEDESPEDRRQRLLRQRKEEERQRRDQEEEEQILNVSVERFTFPEAFFRPSDLGLPLDWASLPQAIVQSIGACPESYQPALYKTIRLIGGLALLSNIKARLLHEIRCLAPAEYDIQLDLDDKPVAEAWQGARKYAATVRYRIWSISRDEWERISKRRSWERLLVVQGGLLV
jgi:actin-related protein